MNDQIKLIDENELACSLEDAAGGSVWFGIDKPKLFVYSSLVQGQYVITNLPDNFRVDSRMLLSVEMVKELLPHLIKFSETGSL